MKRLIIYTIFVFFVLNVKISYSWLDSSFIKVWDTSVSEIERSLGNNLGMSFIYIKPGTFIMGSSANETGRYSNETAHEVTITKGFYIQAKEVTQGQWLKIMGYNPSRFSGCGLDCPVEMVTWDETQLFISKLNELDRDYFYRLPTEAEWEFAARAGTSTPLYSGNQTFAGENNSWQLDKLGWYAGNSCASYSGSYDCSQWKGKQYSCFKCGTQPVGGKEPNRFKLYDMLGNVYEWCNDWYGDYILGHIIDPNGPYSGKYKVIRGGCWNDSAKNCRVASRYYGAPNARSSGVGFRLTSVKK